VGARAAHRAAGDDSGPGRGVSLGPCGAA
jgi:hypothetical protein